MAGVRVDLLDADGDVVDSVTTGADGSYLFDDLALGDYQVRFTAPDGTTLSPSGVGGDRAVDSDADPATGRTGTISLTADAPDNITVDAGVVPPPVRGSIGDLVWSDTDGDGIQDADEPGVAGVRVELLDADGNVVDTVTTGADGSYLFDDLPLGDYQVRFTAPDGTTLSPQNAFRRCCRFRCRSGDRSHGHDQPDRRRTRQHHGGCGCGSAAAGSGFDR